MNTAGCAMMVVFQMALAMGMMQTWSSLVIFLFGLLNYTEACLLDIQSSLDQVDSLSGRKNCETPMLEECREIVDLHARLNRYLFASENPEYAI